MDTYHAVSERWGEPAERRRAHHDRRPIRRRNTFWPIVAALLGPAVMLATCAPEPAHPQEAPSFRPDIRLVGPDGECVERARIVNRVGAYHGAVTMETAHGPVTVTYATVGAHQPGDDDTFEVLD